jgi:hypothetical protein
MRRRSPNPMSQPVVNALTILSIALGLLAIPPLWREWRKRRRHARDIWARLQSRWEPVNDDLNTMVCLGGTFTLQNSGVLPVTNVHILTPEALRNWRYDVIAAGERIELDLSETVMRKIQSERITLQVVDHYDRGWSWTPGENKLEPLAGRSHLLSLVFQW